MVAVEAGQQAQVDLVVVVVDNTVSNIITVGVIEQILSDVCNECHPFYTGKHKIVDTAGRVDQFMRRYGAYTPPPETSQAE